MNFKSYVAKRLKMDEAIDQEKLQQAIDQQRVDPVKLQKAQMVDKNLTSFQAAMELARKIREYTDGKKKMWLLQRNTDYKNEQKPQVRLDMQAFARRMRQLTEEVLQFTAKGEIWHGVNRLVGNDFEADGLYGNPILFIDSLEKQPRPEELKEYKQKVINEEIIEPLRALADAITEYGKMVQQKHPEVFDHHGLLSFRDQNARLFPGQHMTFKTQNLKPAAPAAPAAPEPEEEPFNPATPAKKPGFLSRLFGGR